VGTAPRSVHWQVRVSQLYPPEQHTPRSHPSPNSSVPLPQTAGACEEEEVVGNEEEEVVESEELLEREEEDGPIETVELLELEEEEPVVHVEYWPAITVVWSPLETPGNR